jgi:diacylglycerol kinase family enzyme
MDVKLKVDGEDISGRFLLLEVLNIQYIGPNLFLAPDLVRNDGEFDVVMVLEKHREKLRKHIKQWQEGKLLPPEFKTRRGKRIDIRWTGFPLHIDDKLWPEKGAKKPKVPQDIQFEVEAEAVRFLVPADVHEMQELARKNREKGVQIAEKNAARKKKGRARRSRR